jgi:predicted dehydrogenase
MQKIRWGIIGTGSIAGQFAADMEYVPNGELVAVASRTLATAETFASRFKIPSTYGDYQSLADDRNVDAVYVATPHTLHLQNSVSALQAGKAVLCEKPIAPTVADCEAILKAAQDADTYLMEAMWTYFLPAIRAARTWVDDGRIGKIVRIEAEFGYRQRYDPASRAYNPELAGGVLLDMGIYPIALACLFLSDDPEDIEVVARKAPTGVDDEVEMVFNYPDCVATLSASFRRNLPNCATITGVEGHIVIPEFWRARECQLFQSGKQVDSFTDPRESIGLNYETIAVGEDLAAGRCQSINMPWSATRRFQAQMKRVFEKF